MTQALEQIVAQAEKVEVEELKELFQYIMGRIVKNNYTTQEDFKKDFEEASANIYSELSRIVEHIENFDPNAPEEERVADTKNEIQRDYDYCMNSLKNLDILDLKLLYYIRACFGGEKSFAHALLRELKEEYWHPQLRGRVNFHEMLREYLIREEKGNDEGGDAA